MIQANDQGDYKTWTLDWTWLWAGLNYGLTRKILKLFSIAFYSVVSATKFMSTFSRHHRKLRDVGNVSVLSLRRKDKWPAVKPFVILFHTWYAPSSCATAKALDCTESCSSLLLWFSADHFSTLTLGFTRDSGNWEFCYSKQLHWSWWDLLAFHILFIWNNLFDQRVLRDGDWC